MLTLLQDIERRLPSPQPAESSDALKTDSADGIDDEDDESDVASIPEPVRGLTNTNSRKVHHSQVWRTN